MKKKEKDENIKRVIYENAYSNFIISTQKTRQKEKELEQQKELDLQKWFESEYRKADLSGLMPWCLFCEHVGDKHMCTCDPVQRESETMCVKAYNKAKELLGSANTKNFK